MSSIDNRIVNMQFNNAQFQSGAQESISILDRLKQSLNLSKVQKAADNFNLGGIANSVGQMASKFNAGGAIAFTAINRLTNFAIDKGKELGASLVDPIVEGGKRRALSLEQAKFQFKNLGLNVKKMMESAGKAVDGTAYSLADSASLASRFAATGVKAGPAMVTSLRAVAGAAAMTGAGFSEIGDVFADVQASGVAMAGDFGRLEARGLSAKKVLVDYYKEVKKGEKIQVGSGKTGRSVKAKDLTQSDIGVMASKRQISAKDFAAAMDKAYGEAATKANETYSGALSNYQSALARIGADFASANHEAERRKMLKIIPLFNVISKAIKPVAEQWGEMGKASAKSVGKVVKAIGVYQKKSGEIKVVKGSIAADFQKSIPFVVAAMKNLSTAAHNFLKPISEAWSEVFPPQVQTRITRFAQGINNFAKKLILGDKAAATFKEGLIKFFRMIKLGGSFTKEFFEFIFDKVGFLGSVGKSIVSALEPAIKFIQNFFSALSGGDAGGLMSQLSGLKGSVVDPVISALSALGEALQELWVTKDLDAFKTKFSGVFDPLIELGNNFKNAWSSAIDSTSAALNTAGDIASIIGSKFKNDLGGGAAAGAQQMKSEFGSSSGGILTALNAIWAKLEPIRKIIGEIGSRIGDTIKGLSLTQVIAGFQSLVLIIGSIKIGSLIKNLNDVAKTANKALGGGAKGLNAIAEAIEGLTGVFTAAQQNLKAKTLATIALAIGLFAGSIWVLSKVDPNAVWQSIGALSALIGVLVGAMAALSKATSVMDAASMPALAAGIAVMAGATLVLATAVAKLAELDPEAMLVGLRAILTLLTAMTIVAVVMTKFAGSFVAAAYGLQVMAVALGILAGVVALFGIMEPEVLAQGLTTVVDLMGYLVAAAVILSNFGEGMFVSALGIGAIALALGALVGPITALGFLDPAVLGQGVGTIILLMGTLTVMAVILSKYAPSMVLSALGILAIAAAINLLMIPILVLGSVPFEVLAQGLAGVIIAMAALAAVGVLAQSAIVGAGAMIAMAAAVLILTMAVRMLAEIPIEMIASRLGILLVALGAMAGIGALLTPVAPALLAVGVALLAMGGAVLLAAVGLGILSVVLIPAGFALVGFMAILKEIGIAGPALMAALGAAMLVFGAGALVAGAGVMVLAVGLMLMGAGLAILAAVGIPGAAALGLVVKEIAGMVKYAIQLGIMSAAFLALGAAVTVLGVGIALLGAGMLVLAAGFISTTVAFALFSGVAIAIGAVIQRLFPEIQQLISYAPMLAIFALAALQMGTSMSNMAQAIQATNAGLMFLSTSLSLAANGLTLFNTIATGSLEGIKVSLESLSTATAGSAASLSISALAMGMSFAALGSTISKQATNINLATLRIISGIIIILGSGSARISVEAKKLGLKLGLITIEIDKTKGKTAESTRGVVQAISQTLSNMTLDVESGIKKIMAVIDTLPTRIRSSAPAAATETRKLVEGVSSALGGNLSTLASNVYTNGSAIGRQLMSGMKAGIENNRSLAVGAAQETARQVINATKSTLDIRSPSKVFEKIGKMINRGFVQGLKDEKTRHPIYQAFDDMKAGLKDVVSNAKDQLSKYKETNKKLADSIKSRNKKIDKAERDLKKLQSNNSKGKNNDKIKDKKDQIAELKKKQKEQKAEKKKLPKLRKELKAEKASAEASIKKLNSQTKERSQLKSLYNEREKIIESLEEETKKYEELKKERDDYYNGLVSKFSKLPDIASEVIKNVKKVSSSLPDFNTSYDNFKKRLEKQIKDTEEFRKAMSKIRSMGLSDDLYDQLLDKGVSALKFVNSVIVKGKTGVKELNDMSKDLTKVSESFGTSATTSLVQQYQNDINNSITANNKLKKLLKSAASLGLNDTLYREFADKGTDAVPFLTELVASGKKGVSNLNALNSKLVTSAENLAKDAKNELYSASVQAAKGFVQGLKDNRKAIQDEMDKIADGMVKGLKKKLKIKSPSRVMIGLGKFTGQGLANGLKAMVPTVGSAAESVGDSAMDTLRDVMDEIVKKMAESDEFDLDPTITPILDLSDVRDKSKTLRDLMASVGTMSTADLGSINAGVSSKINPSSVNGNTTNTSESSVSFVQNITSPKAINQVELYRRTNNLLSRAKGALVNK